MYPRRVQPNKEEDTHDLPIPWFRSQEMCQAPILISAATCGAGAARDPGSAAASQASAAGKRGGGGAAKRAGAAAHSPHRLLAAVRKIAPQFKVPAFAQHSSSHARIAKAACPVLGALNWWSGL